MSTQPAIPSDVRIPVVLPVGVQFFSSTGDPLDPQVHVGATRDVSKTGLCIEIAELPVSLAEKLEGQSSDLRIDVDFDIGNRVMRLTGKSMWIRTRLKGCLIGVEYSKVGPELSNAIVQYAERSYHRPKILRAVAAGIVLTMAIGGALYVWSRAAHTEELVAIEAELSDAVRLKQASAAKIDALAQELQTLHSSTTAQDDELLNKKRQLDELRRQFDAVRNKVGELSVSRADLETRRAPEETASYHFEQGHAFSKENNLAAALIEYQRVVALQSEFAAAHLEIAVINDLYGRDAQAVSSYKRYLALRPQAIDAYEIRQNIKELEAELGVK